MFPNVYETLRANATVKAKVGENIGRHGSLQQDAQPPYITWLIAAEQPDDQLSGPPESDFTTVQIDCWSKFDGEVVDLARAVRDALDSAGIANRVVVDLRERDTKLFRVGIDADFITNR
jgi:hypothetical protein